MTQSAEQSVKLENLALNHPVKVLQVHGENATIQAYDWLKSNRSFHWMSLPEIATFPKVDGLDNDLIEEISKYKENSSKRYKSIDILFNTFLYTVTNKETREILLMPEKEFLEANSFFDTYIIHNPEFTIIDPESRTTLLNNTYLNSALSYEFKGALRIDGINGIGWTVGYFKDFSSNHFDTLFGKNSKELKERLKQKSHPRDNYFQGDFPNQLGTFSPLQLVDGHNAFSLETFPLYNNDGVSNPSWDVRTVLYPVIQLSK